MYERSAIVLERYFENLLEYRNGCNIRDNFKNYCDLVEKLEKYQINYEKELAATEEFNTALENIRVIQNSQEKLYKKSAKLEYSRNLLFSNIEGKVEDTRKCIEKIENDVEKNNEAMKETKENLISALEEYNEKRFELSKCKRYKKMAENAYNEAYEVALENYEGITQEVIDLAKCFAKFDDTESIIAELEDNGKNEKIPFNIDVMQNATIFGLDIAKKEAVGYLVIYDKMTKLLTDIQAGITKIELHKKYLRNEKSKMDFLFAVKNYIIQLLDYERMTVIHGRKSHNRLMSEACENFAADVIQINNLYELLLREIANKATKKAYKDLYNKSYLIDIQEKEEKFKKEKNRVNLNTATLINSNYWRIEGIKEIYTVFYKNVSETFGKSVVEFDLPKEENDEESNDEEIYVENIQDEVKEEKVKEKKAKIPFEVGNYQSDEEDDDINIYDDLEDDNDEDDSEEELYMSNKNGNDSEDNNEESDEGTDDYSGIYDDIIDNVVEEFQEGNFDDEEFDIFGEKYKNMDFSETSSIKSKKSIQEVQKMKEEVENSYNFEEENLLEEVKTIKKQKKTKNEIEDIELTEEEPKAKTVIKKIRKISKVKKGTAEDNIW